MKLNEVLKETGIKSWAEDDRPREKMERKGYMALSDAELIAILIQSGTRERSAVDLARELLKMGNLSSLGKLAAKDFQKVKGIGKVRAITLAAALELGRRRQLGEGLTRKEVKGSKEAAEILFPLLSDLQCEKFCLICLGLNNALIHYEFISSGGMNGTVVDPKLVFKTAIQFQASRLIVAHNHPSGSLKPSESDKAITQKLKYSARMLDMQLVDHIIIGDKKYLSFADEGLL
jgi:DNA repair protein RadC